VVSVLLWLGALAGAAERPSAGPVRSYTTWGQGSSRGLLDRWFGADRPPKPVNPKPEKDAKKSRDTKDGKDSSTKESEDLEPTTGINRAGVSDAAAAERKREQDTLLRRLRACDRLLEVAFQTQDPVLQQLAEQLEERAQAVYAQRTSHLPSSVARFESDEKTLDKHLGTGAAPSGSQVGTSPAFFSELDRNGRASAGEAPR
jgi:hypothetical protein